MTKVQFWPCSLLQGKDKNSLCRSLIASFILCPFPAHWAVLAAGRVHYGHISLKLERQNRRAHHPALEASVGSFVPAEYFLSGWERRLLLGCRALGVPCSCCSLCCRLCCRLSAPCRPWAAMGHGAGSWEAAGWGGPAEPCRAATAARRERGRCRRSR